jgi:hypothetical protein
MNKISRGPGALTQSIGKELEANPPSWEAIQAKTRKYNLLATALGAHEPPKGTKDSWATLTSSFAQSAAELDRAAQAKDQKAALAAQGQLAESCMPCHREHRMMRGGGR